MPTERLVTFLGERGVAYETIPHLIAYTAQGVAAAAHVAGRELAKTVVAKVDDGFVLAVLPAPLHVDLEALRRVTGSRSIRLATEQELQQLFPGCEVGAMPPFGNLYGLPVWVDTALAEDPTIVFNAGSHREAIRMTFADFARLVAPQKAVLAVH